MIRVTVIAKSDRRYLQLRFRDPLTGEEFTRSAETANRREAERAAARWESQLRQSGFETPDDVSWARFVALYQAEHLGSLARRAREKSMGTLSRFDEICRISRLRFASASKISEFQAALRERGLAESTIAGMLSTLRAAFSWAKARGLLLALPNFPRIARAKTGSRPKMMRGRPITETEFEKLLAAVPEVVDDDRVEEWRFYLLGMWLSGLRLSESLLLYWDRDDKLSVDTTGSRWMLRIAGEHEKGKQDRLLPITPDFEEFLKSAPEKVGPVFRFSRFRERTERPSHFWVSHIACRIGEAAGVIVDSRGPKYASLHDLRRSFGDRWARLVPSMVLKELMRHESISTTERYYVRRNAESTAEVVYAAYAAKKGDSSGDRPHTTR